MVICLQQEFDVGGAGHSPVERKRIILTINFHNCLKSWRLRELVPQTNEQREGHADQVVGDVQFGSEREKCGGNGRS